MKFRYLISIVIALSIILFIKIIYSGNFTHLQDINANLKLSAILKGDACHKIKANITTPKIETMANNSSFTNIPFANLYPTKNYSLCEIQDVDYPVKSLSINLLKQDLDLLDSINLVIGNKLFRVQDIAPYTTINDDRATIDLSTLKYSSGFMNTYGGLNLIIQSITYFLTAPISLALAFGLIFSYILSQRDYAKDYQLFSNFLEKRYILILSFIITLGALFRINGMHFHSLWGDEIYSALKAANIYLDFKSVFVDPGNPPFYFFLLKMWFYIFGFNEFVARSLSVFIGTLGILSVFIFAKNHINIKVALIASLFYALSYQLIGSSHEVRGYVLTMAVVPSIANYFFHLLKDFNFKNLLIYFLIGICAVNIHYYVSIFYFVNFLFIIFYNIHSLKAALKKISIFLVLNILTALSLMPYFYITAYSQALTNRSFNTWIPNPNLNDIFLTPLNMIGSGLLFVVAIFFFIYIFRFKNLFIKYALFTIILMVALPFIASFIRPIFVQKYVASIIYPIILVTLAYVSVNLKLQKGKEIFFILMIVAVLNTTLDSKVRHIGFGSTYSVQLEYMSLDSKQYVNNGINVKFLLSTVAALDKIQFVDKFYNVSLGSNIITSLNKSNLPQSGVLYIDNYFSSESEIKLALDYYKDRASIIRLPIDKASYIYKIIIDK